MSDEILSRLDRLEAQLTRVENNQTAVNNAVFKPSDRAPGSEQIVGQPRADGAVRLFNVEALIASLPAGLRAKLAASDKGDADTDTDADGNRWYFVHDAPTANGLVAAALHRVTNDAMQYLIGTGGGAWANRRYIRSGPAGTYAFAGVNGPYFAGIGVQQARGVVLAHIEEVAQEAGGPTYDEFVKAGYRK